MHVTQAHAELAAMFDRGEKQVERHSFDSPTAILGDPLAHAGDVNFAAQRDHLWIDGDRTAGGWENARRGVSPRAAS